jgi:endonuclease/exonuclease/phosphatase (EEP) superfamily protein YafD
MKPLHGLFRFARAVCVFVLGGYLAALVAHLALRLTLGDSAWPFNFFNLFTPLYFAPLALVVPALALLRARRAALVGVALLALALTWPIQWYWPRGEATPTPGALTVRVLTFNALRSNHELGVDSDWLRAQNADVLFLQEMSEYYGQYWVQWLDEQYPYWVQHGTNITMSRHPLRDGGAHRAPTLPDAQNENSQTADDGQSVEVRFGLSLLTLEGQTIALYNVHMPQPVDPARFGLRNSFQRMAANYATAYRDTFIRALLDVLRAETRPFIAGGDFNTHDQNAIYAEIAALMNDSFRARAYGPGWSWPVGENTSLNLPLPPFLRLDYIWHSDDFRALQAWQGPALSSDHVPLVALLELLPPVQASATR